MLRKPRMQHTAIAVLITLTFSLFGFSESAIAEYQLLDHIVAIVEAAGGKIDDITRLTWFVIDKKEYLAKQREVGAAYRRVMGRHYPAMSVLVVAGLIEDEALVEIEATAEIGSAAST